MPAITVDDPLTLPAISEPAATSAVRPVLSVTTAPAGFEGEGFPVRRAFAGVAMHLLDPFVHMDQMGEVEYAPASPRAPLAPPPRFETVTYMIDGTFQHHDSKGGGGLITDGDTQWMTAGSGLLHIERPPDDLVASGGLFHGVQLWVNLPAADKFVDPRYQDIRGGEVKLLRSPDGGALLRVIAGTLDGHDGPGVTHTPITYVHATVAPGRGWRCPGPPTTTPWCTCSPGGAPSATATPPGRCAPASWPCLGPATTWSWRPTPTRTATPPTSRCCCWAGAPSASRWRTTARSS